ncbi:spexin prohormone 2 isoform X2 [Danio rerio]|uniref:Spexin prohormone 2 isoform X2 n=1 Tax=Danio rerio TaxID=7955 RepID=A0AC58IU41_DANRE
MSELEGHEYTYRIALPEGSVAPFQHPHGSPGMGNLVSHQTSAEPVYSRMEEDEYTTYRILHPVARDPIPQVAHFSSAAYSEYLLAQPSHYQHVQYGGWPSHEAFQYSMSSGNQPHALLLSPHDQHKMVEKIPAQTSNICQMLQVPVQVVCDVNVGGPVMVLNHCSPDQIPHSMMSDLNAESVSMPAQSFFSEHHSPHEPGSDIGHIEMIVSAEAPQTHSTSAEVTVSLSPEHYVSQFNQTLYPTQAFEHEEVVQTKGCESVKWEKSKRPCNCTKSQCLKLYCECFANGEFCSSCKCTNCFNNTEHVFERSQAVKACLDRNPGAFRPKIGSRKQGNVKGCHTKGCNCKRSGCLKNYCECYEAKIMCTSTCKCVGCRNYDEGCDMKKSSEQDRHDIYFPTRCPVSVITRDVVEATCGCLLAQAEEAQKDGHIAAHAERMILEEFGQCLTQIVRSIFKSSRVQFNL